jgi:clusterin-associated protein 1
LCSPSRNVREIIKQQTENIEEMKNYVNDLERDEKILEEKIRRQTVELERAEKRLKGITTVRPAYMDEYERHEQELERLYALYLEKFRNLDYLEHQMDLYTAAEEDKFNANQEHLRKMREKIKAEEWRMLRGEDEMVISP